MVADASDLPGSGQDPSDLPGSGQDHRRGAATDPRQVHCLEHGIDTFRPTDDGDVVLGVRTNRQAQQNAVKLLQARGFSLAETSDGFAYRYERGCAELDLLCVVRDHETNPGGTQQNGPTRPTINPRTRRSAVRQPGNALSAYRDVELSAVMTHHLRDWRVIGRPSRHGSFGLVGHLARSLVQAAN